MMAVRIHEYGASDVLTYENTPRPVPGEGEILVRVHATTVNPFDIAIRSGYMASSFNHSFPLVPRAGSTFRRRRLHLMLQAVG